MLGKHVQETVSLDETTLGNDEYNHTGIKDSIWSYIVVVLCQCTVLEQHPQTLFTLTMEIFNTIIYYACT